jgi:hypothetical protein
VNSLILPMFPVRRADEGAGGDEGRPAAHFLITPQFFAAMRTPLVRGREFDDRDSSASPWVAVINEALARRLWPGDEALGRSLVLGVDPAARPRQVVGVVRDIPTRLGQATPDPIVYAPVRQPPTRHYGRWVGMYGEITFVLRHAGEAAALLPLARQAASQVDPDRPIVGIGRLERALRARMGASRNFVTLLGAFAITATVLAAIGVYGVVAHAVGQRTREIGIRKALGASALELLGLVGRGTIALVAAGVLAGLAAALALTRLIASQLWGVTPTDPVTFAAVSAFILVVAAAAAAVPARRALSVDPAVTLRAE